ncbi:MAG: 4Fe-4S binding protein [Sutterellaceae bacterium]|nr:4Fe-4S binding protein [Sutterellaceae bacterium]
MTVYCMYFSPCGSTESIAREAAETLDSQCFPVNLTNRDCFFPTLSENDLVVVAGPVYGGRIPAPMAEKLARMRGNGAKALALVVYGNRAYEDALLETVDLLTASGFHAIAAGAFIARHVFVPEVAADRPDEADFAQIRKLAQDFAAKAQNTHNETIAVPGNRPYRDGIKPVFAPSVSMDDCRKCGICVHACPTGAIDQTSPDKVDLGLCINCMRCVECCAEGLRDLPQAAKDAIRTKLSPLIGVTKPNEIFV